jgi:antitoxin (DNA-binding transcriptional repressor) of toxin-antitoxin stability system
MSTIQWNDVAADPARFLARVEAGESLTVERDGTPVVELRPALHARLEPRPYGLCKGEFTVPDDFNDPLPDKLLDLFEGR